MGLPFWNPLAVSYKTKHSITMQLSNGSLDIYPSEQKLKILHMNVHSHFAHNFPKLETTKMLFSR
jgi:hypothetical protein